MRDVSDVHVTQQYPITASNGRNGQTDGRTDGSKRRSSGCVCVLVCLCTYSNEADDDDGGVDGATAAPMSMHEFIIIFQQNENNSRLGPN